MRAVIEVRAYIVQIIVVPVDWIWRIIGVQAALARVLWWRWQGLPWFVVTIFHNAGRLHILDFSIELVLGDRPAPQVPSPSFGGIFFGSR